MVIMCLSVEGIAETELQAAVAEDHRGLHEGIGRISMKGQTIHRYILVDS